MKDDQREIDRRVAAINTALRRVALKTDAQMGRLGERFAKVAKEKTRIPSLTGTAKYRVPDVLSDGCIVEVKNVKCQALTNQIRDFLAYCDNTGRRFVLCIRDDARMSCELEELVKRGRIEIRPLGYIFTKEGMAKFFRAIEPIVAKA